MLSVSLYVSISILNQLLIFKKKNNMGVMPVGQRGSNRSSANICVTIRS
jgi:hypothetical protein